MVSRIMIGGSAGFRMMIALPLLGPAEDLDRLRRGAGELVDVLAGARAGRRGRHGGHDLRVVHVDDPRHGVHHRDGGLSATGDHVDVGLV